MQLKFCQHQLAFEQKRISRFSEQADTSLRPSLSFDKDVGMIKYLLARRN